MKWSGHVLKWVNNMLYGNERVCVQGITGRYGKYHTKKMKEYGTNIVCGVSKNKKIDQIEGIPVYNNMKEAVERTNADTSIIFIPAPKVLEAATEALDNGIKKLIIITEHVPQHDSLKIFNLAKEKNAVMVGPNCPGVILPGIMKLGIMPESSFKPGDVAIISRSGTLMYEVAHHISKNSSGVKIGIGLGGDPVIGTNVSQAMDFVISGGIKKVVLVGEVGGSDEITGIAEGLKKGFKGEIQAFFAGRSVPKGKTMGHAGAIIEGLEGTIEYKEKKLMEMGVSTFRKFDELFV